MNLTRLGVIAPIVASALLAGSVRADLLVAQATGEPASYRAIAEGELACSIEAIEAALVLFFPPVTTLTVPDPDPQNDPGDPPTDPPGPPDDPGDPGDPPDDPDDPDDPGVPPHHNPEPASLVTCVVGSSLVCCFGWWRRRPQPPRDLAAA